MSEGTICWNCGEVVDIIRMMTIAKVLAVGQHKGKKYESEDSRHPRRKEIRHRIGWFNTKDFHEVHTRVYARPAFIEYFLSARVGCDNVWIEKYKLERGTADQVLTCTVSSTESRDVPKMVDEPPVICR